MSAITERYDRDARDYERYWAPVLDRAARRLLDDCEPFVRAAKADGTVRILDVGTGAGVLATEAATRWPHAEVVGVDSARGMLAVAQDRAARLAEHATDGRLRWLRGEADDIPVAAGSFDLVVSSFVYQLVRDRTAAFREALRVLRPAGHLAYVTWLAGRDGFAPADEFDEAVYDLEIEEPEYTEEERSGDLRSIRAATAELRGAGFRRVSARRDRLEYTWTLDSYLEYKERYDERALMSDLGPGTSGRLMARARERMERLGRDAFRWRPPIIYVVGQRPPESGRG
jgi:SAM-dependent methyltransferase